MANASVDIPRINWESNNLVETWKRFKQHAELMFSGPLKDKSEAEKCSYLLIWVGEKGRDIFNTWPELADEDRDKLRLKPIYTRFEGYVAPKSNPIFARFKFYNRTQGQAEPVEQFITDLKLLAKDCAFDNADEMIRDRIVFGTNSQKVRERLFSEGGELTLDKAASIARNYELAKDQLKSMTDDDDVYAIRRCRYVTKSTDPRARRNTEAAQMQETKKERCQSCGGQPHRNRDFCPAKGKTCFKCRKLNHFARLCRSTRIDFIEDETVSDEEEPTTDLFIGTISAGQTSIKDEDTTDIYIENISTTTKTTVPDEVFVTMNLVGVKKSMEFKLDTGAQVNVIPWRVAETFDTFPKLQPVHNHLYGYSGKHLDVKGQCKIECRYRDICRELVFYVVNTDAPPVLSLKSCLEMNLIKLILSTEITKRDNGPGITEDDLLQDYKDVFTGIGLFPGEHRIEIDPNVNPVIHAARKIPIALQKRLKEELDEMQKKGVIVPVEAPTDWVSSLVVVEKQKGGKLRVCLDPRDLNRAIKREYYPLPTLEDITAKLSKAKFFTKLDACSGYWQVKLDQDSSMLTTFNTPFGRYRFLRMPFGVHSAQDVFQRLVDKTFGDLPGVAAIIDDILVYGETKQEHDKNLRATLQRAGEQGVTFNPEKLTYCAQEVSYFGNRITSEGLKPDNVKIAAIVNMPVPKNKAELQVFLGMVNYLSKFSATIPPAVAPLRALLKKNTSFVWGAQEEKAFAETKTAVTHSETLSYFDPTVKVELEVDASMDGLGAALFQNGKPVAFASKALTPIERNYAQIEKELYAIVFGCERFHQFVYGRTVVIYSDHKPLEAIMKKPLAETPPRLQRMILRLQKYDIQVTYKSGKKIPVADALSRQHLSETDEIGKIIDVQVHMVINSFPITDTKLTIMKEETAKDTQLTKVIQTIKDGWPDNKHSLPKGVEEFWNFRSELSVLDGLLFRGEKLVVPKALRQEMLTRIHTGHLGIEKCKRRARDVLFWPRMNAQIEDVVLGCSICSENAIANQKEPLINRKIPFRPWEVVATDLFTVNGLDYLLVVDFYSRYPEIEKLENTSSSIVISKLKSIFARHGIPAEVVSDNGPQYTSKEFTKFATDWDFKHNTSSPRYPQSNGLAEKYVQITKRLIEKARKDGRDPFLSLLEYRNTPIDKEASPAQLLMSRRSVPFYLSHPPSYTQWSKIRLVSSRNENTNNLNRRNSMIRQLRFCLP